MEIEFDPAKSELNEGLRGLPFSLVAEFDFDSAVVAEDTRENYGETRWVAIGLIGDRLHVVVFTTRGDAVRVISLRKANDREIARYDEAQS
jgi:uncharacterized DUF497 family protein